MPKIKANKKTVSKMAPIAQKVKWESGVNGDQGVGMIVESELGADFIPWDKLKLELEEKLLIQLGRVLGDKKYTLKTDEFHGRKNWLVHIIDENKNTVGSVWLGGNPDQGWKWDGLVRVGNAPDEHSAKVWQVFGRYSDGSYRRLEAFDTLEDQLSA